MNHPLAPKAFSRSFLGFLNSMHWSHLTSILPHAQEEKYHVSDTRHILLAKNSETGSTVITLLQMRNLDAEK